MTKLTMTIAMASILATAGCVADREPSTVRNGPQAEAPNADAPGGKMPANTVTQVSVPVETIIIDDSAPRTGSIVQTVFN